MIYKNNNLKVATIIYFYSKLYQHYELYYGSVVEKNKLLKDDWLFLRRKNDEAELITYLGNNASTIVSA